MKQLYWRPQKVSRAAIALVASLAVTGLAAVEGLPVQSQTAHYEQKVRASRLAAEAMEAVKAERLARGHAIDPQVDPTESGIIGVLSSPITSNSGHLPAKQLSTNPNFAALVLELLDDAGVDPGEVVAVGASGSLPALNIATYSALTTLEAEPVVITSAASSEWGANIIGFGWPDMEDLLVDRGFFPFRSIAGSLGGIEDQALGMSRAGRSMLRGMLERHEIAVLELDDISLSVAERVRLYDEAAAGRPIAAYVNVGGGAASLGSRAGRAAFKSGLNLPSSFPSMEVDSVMGEFIRRGVPVIHLHGVADLAEVHGIPPLDPTAPPEVGEGRIFVSVAYNAWLAVGVLLAVVLALYATIRSDIGTRLLGSGRTSSTGRPEPMV